MNLSECLAALREKGVELPEMTYIDDLAYFADTHDHITIKTPGKRGSITIGAGGLLADIADLLTVIEQQQERIAVLKDELATERGKRCATCGSCSPAGLCRNETAMLSVRYGYPVQSDFGCVEWWARAQASPDAACNQGRVK